MRNVLSAEITVGISYVWLEFAHLDRVFILTGYFVSIFVWNMAREKFFENNNHKNIICSLSKLLEK